MRAKVLEDSHCACADYHTPSFCACAEVRIPSIYWPCTHAQYRGRIEPAQLPRPERGGIRERRRLRSATHSLRSRGEERVALRLRSCHSLPFLSNMDRVRMRSREDRRGLVARAHFPSTRTGGEGVHMRTHKPRPLFFPTLERTRMRSGALEGWRTRSGARL